jgi:hypothetical protein
VTALPEHGQKLKNPHVRKVKAGIARTARFAFILCDNRSAMGFPHTGFIIAGSYSNGLLPIDP